MQDELTESDKILLEQNRKIWLNYGPTKHILGELHKQQKEITNYIEQNAILLNEILLRNKVSELATISKTINLIIYGRYEYRIGE